MTVLLLALIVASAFFIEAALGFGATVVTVALGALLFPIDTLLPAFIPLNIVLSAYISWRYRRDICWGLLLKRIVPLMLIGMPAGILLFGSGEDRLLSLVFGVFVIILSGVELLRLARQVSTSQSQPLSLWFQAIYLILGGFIHGAYATGGPMAIYVAGRELDDKAQFRSSLSMLWLLLNSVLVVSYAITGAFTSQSFELMGTLVAPLLVGMLLGDWLQKRINQRVFRLSVFLLLLVAGTVLVGKS